MGGLFLRILDICLSLIILLITTPFLAVSLFLVYLNDFENPFYVSERVGKNFRNFKIFKIRTMIKNADKYKIDSTSEKDFRLTKVGKLIRKYKFDEFLQFFNVLIGNMSIVGPRPNVIREVNLYTDEEKFLLSKNPGITDPSSIIFSDLSQILTNYEDPDIAYNQLVRPWKSRISIFYLKKRNIISDLIIITLTFLSIFSRKLSLLFISKLLKRLGASREIINISIRNKKLTPSIPPGGNAIVKSRVERGK